MMRPPRVAERLLASLGADPYLRDVVLGDLAEEFAARTASDGERSARRWYVGEAIRNIPFFLRSWRRGLRWRKVSRLVGIAASTYALLVVIGLGVGSVGLALWTILRLPPFELRHLMLTGGEVVYLIPLAVAAVISVLGGAIAAWLDAETPIVSALTFGCLYAGAFIVGATATDFGPLWYRVTVPVVFVVGTVVGSLLRIARSSDTAVAIGS